MLHPGEKKGSICDDPKEKGMFQDVDVKFQEQMYLKYDVDVLIHAFFLWIVTYMGILEVW